MSLQTFASRLDSLMQTEKVSKRALSLQAGIQRKSILNWLDAKFYPRYDSLIKLTNFFHVSCDYMLGLESECFADYHSQCPLEKVPQLFISRLQEFLIEKQMTEYKLAKLLHIGQSSLSKWTHQNSMPETALIIEIAKLMQTSVDFLLGRTHE